MVAYRETLMSSKGNANFLLILYWHSLMEIDSITRDLIQQIYGGVPEALIRGLEKLSVVRESQMDSDLWSERDVVLITYADQVRSPDLTPLQAQRQFLLDQQLVTCMQVLQIVSFYE